MIGVLVAGVVSGGLGGMRWIIVAATSGMVSTIGITQETRTTSLLLTRWAQFLALIVIALDVAVAELVTALVKTGHRGVAAPGVNIPWLHTPLIWITIGAVAPALLRSFKLPMGSKFEGPFYPYSLARKTLLVRLDDECGTQMELKARLLARKALESQILPEDLADVMRALVKRRRVSRTTKSELGQILGALRAGDQRDQMERLVELMHQYRMRALIRDLETGRITRFLQASPSLRILKPDEGDTTAPARQAPSRPPRGTAGPSPPSSRTRARPARDRQGSGQIEHREQEQDQRGT